MRVCGKGAKRIRVCEEDAWRYKRQDGEEVVS